MVEDEIPCTIENVVQLYYNYIYIFDQSVLSLYPMPSMYGIFT